MEKILLIIQGEQIDRRAIEFACYVADLTRSHLIAAFLEPFQTENVPLVKTMYGSADTGTITSGDFSRNEESKRILKYNTTLFKEICANAGIRCSIHDDHGEPLEELIKESRYADLIIVDAAISGIEKTSDIPTDFFRDSLTRSECPVIIAPPDFEEVDEIIFLYDGSESSVFAIKQFTYLFSGFSDKKLIVLHTNKSSSATTWHEQKINELLRPHYSRIGFQELNEKEDNALFDFLLHKKNVFLVTGAFSRSIFAILSKPDKAELFVKTVNFPIFIAHH